MHSFDTNYKNLYDEKGNEYPLSKGTVHFLNADGTVLALPSNHPASVEALKNTLVSLDVAGNVIYSYSSDSKGIEIKYSVDSADVTQPDEAEFKQDYPMAVTLDYHLLFLGVS